MALVVQDENRQTRGQLAQPILRERVWRLLSLVDNPVTYGALTVSALERKGMRVGDQHLAAAQQRTVLRRDQIAAVVEVLGRLRLQALEAFAPGKVRRAQRDGARQGRARWIAAAVSERPRDTHSHQSSVAAGCCHLPGEPPQR